MIAFQNLYCWFNVRDCASFLVFIAGSKSVTAILGVFQRADASSNQHSQFLIATVEGSVL